MGFLSLPPSLHFLKPHSKRVSEGDGAAAEAAALEPVEGGDQQERTGAGQNGR